MTNDSYGDQFSNGLGAGRGTALPRVDQGSGPPVFNPSARFPVVGEADARTGKAFHVGSNCEVTIGALVAVVAGIVVSKIIAPTDENCPRLLAECSCGYSGRPSVGF